VPSFSHSIDVSQAPADVFPWLLDEDKVPKWTGDLDSYTQLGPLGQGAQVRQVLSFGGNRITVELEITVYDPPDAAETRFSSNGVDVTSVYALEPAGSGTRLTQTLDAKATSFTARMLIPVVQGRLEQKLTQDLERLKGLLDGA
jgi:carbon monoxide dehydrogenase subunit G